MQKVSTLLHQLQVSISSQKIDFELLEMLKQALTEISLTTDNFEHFVNLIIQIYKLSNKDKLYTIKKISISISQMAIQLKILVCKMMTTVIEYFQRSKLANSIPLHILSQAIQMMIICARVCLNEGSHKYISKVQQFYNLIHNPYDYVERDLRKNIRFFHQINVLELMRYRCENQTFSIVEFKKRLAQTTSFQQFNLPDYRRFVQNIIMQIVLKSIKNGKLKPENLKSFYPYLSETNQKDLHCLVFDPDDSIKNMESGSEFLQIYKQIKEQGIQSINFEFLEDFIKNDMNFNDDRLFQIAALTMEPVILEIWFRVLNSKKQKSSVLQKALICYIHIVDSILFEVSSQKQKKEYDVYDILKLSNSIAFSLLTQRKSSALNQPVLHIIKTLVKVLTWICFSLHENWEEIKDFGQRTVLLCSRYQCIQISKVIYSVMLYYCLVKKQKAQDIYERFVAHHLNEKSSEIYKLLSCAYEVQNSRVQGFTTDQRIDQELKQLMRNKPFVGILFAEKNEDMTIFEIEPNKYKQIQEKFYIYVQMLKKYQNDEAYVHKIIDHLEEFLIKTSVEEFQEYMLKSKKQKISIQELFMILVEMLAERQSKNSKILKDQSQKIIKHNLQSVISQNQGLPSQLRTCSSQICFILINLYILGNQTMAREFKDAGYGVLLNKYSVKIKMISKLSEMVKNGNYNLEPDMYSISCSYLLSVLQKFKILAIRKERIGEPGQISFVHTVQGLIETYYQLQEQTKLHNQSENNQKPAQEKGRQCQLFEKDLAKKNLMRFTIFQIDCLTNNSEKYMKLIQKLPLSLLNTFTNSLYIPKNLKQKIFRRIVRENITSSKFNISLKEFKEIIQITQDPQEVQLYIQYVFATFGQNGRKMLMIMANQNKKIQQILLNETDIEI